jgi:flagellar biosynthesis chaperone FliJ
VTQKEKTLAELTEELGELKNDLTQLDSGVLGNRANAREFKETLQGRIETLEATCAKLKEQMDGWRNSLNKGVERVSLTAIGALVAWLMSRVLGG